MTRAESNTCYYEVKNYLKCLAAVSASAPTGVRLVLDAYRDMFKSNNAQNISVAMT
jgi:hypothetical protein